MTHQQKRHDMAAILEFSTVAKTVIGYEAV